MAVTTELEAKLKKCNIEIGRSIRQHWNSGKKRHFNLESVEGWYPF